MLQGIIISDGGNTTMNNGYTTTGQETVNIEPTYEQYIPEDVNISEENASIPEDVDIPEEEDVKDFTAQFKGLFDAFAEQIPNNSQERKSAKRFFKKFSDYVGSKDFENDVNEKAEKYKVPPKQIVKNFFLKVLGIIGKFLGVVIKIGCSIISAAITLFTMLLRGTAAIIKKVGSAIASTVSSNQKNDQADAQIC